MKQTVEKFLPPKQYSVEEHPVLVPLHPVHMVRSFAFSVQIQYNWLNLQVKDCQPLPISNPVAAIMQIAKMKEMYPNFMMQVTKGN